jgi:hypothetical protein
MLTVYLIWPYKKKYHPEETDPEIIYAIDENDPVMCEIGGTSALEKVEEPESADTIEESSAEENAENAAEENPEPPKKQKKCIFKKIKELCECRSRRFVTSYILVIIALILEFGAIIPFVGIATLIVMPKIKKRTTMIVFGILNMVFGGNIISLIAGILMIFTPERALLKACKEPVPEACESAELKEATEDEKNA